MRLLSPFENLFTKARLRFAQIREARFFEDRMSVGLMIVAMGLNIVGFLLLLPKVHPTDLPVAVSYSSLDLGYTLGGWFFPYEIILFGIGVTLVNSALAYRSFSRSRLASFYLLAGAVVVSVFSLIIANALGAVR
jgi:hypothetical protein